MPEPELRADDVLVEVHAAGVEKETPHCTSTEPKPSYSRGGRSVWLSRHFHRSPARTT